MASDLTLLNMVTVTCKLQLTSCHPINSMKALSK